MEAKILVIDDEEGIRFTFNKFLSEKEYDVSTAKNFDEALHSITENNFDVIFADIILKGKSGLDVLREVKKRSMNCPVIMITGYPNIDSAADAIRLGAFDYIPKPVRKEELLHTTQSALSYKALVEEKEKFRSNLEAIFRSVKDAIITVDPELSLLEVNEASNKICGFSRSDIGKGFSIKTHKCKTACLEYLKNSVNKMRPVEVHRLECQRKNRPSQVVTLSISPLLNNLGIFSGSIMIVRDETRITDLEQKLKDSRQFHKIIGKSRQMQEIFSLIELLSDVETTVLITGESGTGKELVAEALHYKGTRARKPIVRVNCSALSENLLESELFGHVKGAFTGAIKDKIGRFQLAEGGTIFLDEIAEVSPKIQVDLLRVLEKKEFERVGDSNTIKVNVRVVTATNQDLFKKVKRGEFREDLFYRLNVMKIFLPPLRERREDIPLLVDHFLENFNKKFNKNIDAISADVQKLFMNYPWPGNIRELKHVIEHAFIICNDQVIKINHLSPELKSYYNNENLYLRVNQLDDSQTIKHALQKTAWNKTKAAQLLGISRRSLYRKIKDYKIYQD
jgi:PAS domain S-box-containing protein